MNKPDGITRRDFLNGCALSLAAGSGLAPLELLAAADASPGYPPRFTGMRGSHPGSFEVAHALALGEGRWPRPAALSDDVYDLVVVGGGISGLAAAHYWRARRGARARILVLDNHDDIGGHARRNEFDVDGRKLIGYGGSQAFESPGRYSATAKRLLADLGIDVQRFYDWYDAGFNERFGLVNGMHFSRAAYGRDVVLPTVASIFGRALPADPEAVLADVPLPGDERLALGRLLAGGRDYLADLERDAKLAQLRRVSYSDFLRRFAGMPESVVRLYRDTVKGYWGVGWDALSALEAWRLDMPGTAALGLGTLEGEQTASDEPYIFHFPDGNATLARALLHRLRPDVLAARDIEDLVTARLDYARLDAPGSRCRVRLNSTAVDVRHVDLQRAVDVTYVHAGRAHRVRARHVVLACYNAMVPYLCPDTPEPQREALEWPEKVPIVYLSIAVRNWRPFARLGYADFYVPESPLMHSFGLDFPVSIGQYRFTDDPGQPTAIHGTFVPTLPDSGLPARRQHAAGRRRLLEMSFDEFERGIVAQFDGALAGGGFDAERDIAAITVNRWPHGYAYEYNDYSDPPEWGRERGPHLAARAPVGRISIANSDSEAYAYADGAIDAAARAVAEQAGEVGSG